MLVSDDEGTATEASGADSAVVPSIDLCVVSGPEQQRTLSVSHGRVRIGVSEGCELRLSDKSVSRLHCEIVMAPTGARVVDLGSTNGTFIDGVRVRDADLVPGSMLKVGESVIRVEQSGRGLDVPLSLRTELSDMVGSSVAMRRLYAVIERAAPTEATMLVTGETGTGKELVARAVHELSARSEGPFVAIDCGALSESLIESELFGHVRGSFSGAIAERKGLFEQASGGTLFLDEVGELPLGLQAKLLRALETREVRRVGSNEMRPIDVRLVAATNRPLSRCVNEGMFREDLYFRLAVIELLLPPLRARREDIPQLAQHFHKRFAATSRALSPSVLAGLVARSWPGNVRELRNFIERLAALQLTDGVAPDAYISDPSQFPEALVPVDLPMKEAGALWMQQFEGAYVRALLRKTDGNVTQAAELAGVNRRYLYRVLSRLGLRSDELAGDDED